ncbi:P44/Msp2 family outer membrane protein [Anaplasma phagocytophilum]|uniref:P44/Msp2 family outer membrane protein n=1 Tax=Anaplasma phagocytophilum TaxID=948 RepID=UPI00200EAD84|nr:P44/Msp2 family outer membrane protein [Anaplasma phagocytophilum]UQD54277.1 P44/Msp2 family outer membrane protein [Anaplasma phagocytophilum]
MKLVERIVGRKSVSALVIFCMILCVPFQAFSHESTDNFKSKNRLYFAGTYKISVPNFGSLEVEESNSHVPNVGTVLRKSMKGNVLVSIEKHKSFDAYYKEEFYSNDYFGFSGSIGYAINNFRIEVEGMNSEFKIKAGKGSVHKDDAFYIALVRERTISNNNYVVVKNKSVAVTSVALSLCYDIKSLSDIVISYLCFGVSGNAVDLLETRKLTHGYYGRIGAGFLVTRDILLSVGGYYHRLHANEFSGLKLFIPASTAREMRPAPTSAHAKMDIAYLGVEMSLRYSF